MYTPVYLQRLDSHDVHTWREVDVYQWILQLSQQSTHSDELSQYAPLFMQNNISGKHLLQLSQSDLRTLGIHSLGHVIDLHVRDFIVSYYCTL